MTRAQGSSVGHTFEQLKFMIDLVDDKSRIGVCLDTCHLFAAGVPLSVLTRWRALNVSVVFSQCLIMAPMQLAISLMMLGPCQRRIVSSWHVGHLWAKASGSALRHNAHDADAD